MATNSVHHLHQNCLRRRHRRPLLLSHHLNRGRHISFERHHPSSLFATEDRKYLLDQNRILLNQVLKGILPLRVASGRVMEDIKRWV